MFNILIIYDAQLESIFFIYFSLVKMSEFSTIYFQR